MRKRGMKGGKTFGEGTEDKCVRERGKTEQNREGRREKKEKSRERDRELFGEKQGDRNREKKQ